MTLIYIMGPPASGKSSFAHSLSLQNDASLFHLDDFSTTKGELDFGRLHKQVSVVKNTPTKPIIIEGTRIPTLFLHGNKYAKPNIIFELVVSRNIQEAIYRNERPERALPPEYKTRRNEFPAHIFFLNMRYIRSYKFIPKP